MIKNIVKLMWFCITKTIKSFCNLYCIYRYRVGFRNCLERCIKRKVGKEYSFKHFVVLYDMRRMYVTIFYFLLKNGEELEEYPTMIKRSECEDLACRAMNIRHKTEYFYRLDFLFIKESHYNNKVYLRN